MNSEICSKPHCLRWTTPGFWYCDLHRARQQRDIDRLIKRTHRILKAADRT